MEKKSALAAATTPSPGERSRIGTMVKYWKATPISEGDDVVEDPHREDLLAEQGLPAEPDGDGGKGEGAPIRR